MSGIFDGGRLARCGATSSCVEEGILAGGAVDLLPILAVVDVVCFVCVTGCTYCAYRG